MSDPEPPAVDIIDHNLNHTFTVERNCITSLGFGSEITSKTFGVGSNSNELELQVGLRNIGLTPVSISFRVTLYGKVKKVSVFISNCKFEFETVNPTSVIKPNNDGQIVKWIRSKELSTFQPIYQAKVSYNLNINKNNKGRRCIPNGQLCVTTTGIVLVPITASENLPKCKCDFQKDFSALLQEPKYSDVDIFVGGRNFSAHKVILWSRSKGFAKLFEQLEIGNNSINIISINNFNPDVVHEALHYIYTGTCPRITDIPFEILAFGKEFEIQGLIKLCESTIKSSINVDNVSHILDLADKENAEDVKSFCVDFITHNSRSVIATDGWKDLSRRNSAVIVTVFETLAIAHNGTIVE